MWAKWKSLYMNFKNLSLIQTCNFNLTDFLKLRKLYYELLNKRPQNHKSKNVEESLVSASKCCPKIKPPPSPRANSHSPEAVVFQKFIPLPPSPNQKRRGKTLWLFSIKDFFSKCHQIRSFLWIWSYLLKKSQMENFIFCAVSA